MFGKEAKDKFMYVSHLIRSNNKENKILDEADDIEFDNGTQHGCPIDDKQFKKSDAMENEILDDANDTEVDNVPLKGYHNVNKAFKRIRCHGKRNAC